MVTTKWLINWRLGIAGENLPIISKEKCCNSVSGKKEECGIRREEYYKSYKRSVGTVSLDRTALPISSRVKRSLPHSILMTWV